MEDFKNEQKLKFAEDPKKQSLIEDLFRDLVTSGHTDFSRSGMLKGLDKVA